MSKREILKNNAATTLFGSITNSATSIAVNDGSVFPTTGDFRLLIDSEIMLCTARSTNTLTVVRGQEGRTAAAHADTAPVTHILTLGALQAYGRDNTVGFDGSRPSFRLLDASGNTLTSSDFTVVNGTNATITDSDGQIIIRKTSTVGQDFALLARTKTSELIIAMRCLWPAGVNGCRLMAAIGARESATGKLILFSLERMTSGFIGFSIYGFSSPTTEGATRLNPFPSVILGPEVWLRVTDDGTNLHFYVSDDGVTWVSLYAQTRVTDFTTAPDQWVWGASSNSNSFNAISRLVAWQE